MQVSPIKFKHRLQLTLFFVALSILPSHVLAGDSVTYDILPTAKAAHSNYTETNLAPLFANPIILTTADLQNAGYSINSHLPGMNTLLTRPNSEPTNTSTLWMLSLYQSTDDTVGHCATEFTLPQDHSCLLIEPTTLQPDYSRHQKIQLTRLTDKSLLQLSLGQTQYINNFLLMSNVTEVLTSPLNYNTNMLESAKTSFAGITYAWNLPWLNSALYVGATTEQTLVNQLAHYSVNAQPLQMRENQWHFGIAHGNLTGALTKRKVALYTPVLLSSNAFDALDLDISWNTPWQGQLSVGAKNVLVDATQNIEKASVKSPVDLLTTRTPYVRYTQDF